MRSAASLACAGLLATALAACDAPGAAVTIDLRTDLAPGHEFTTVRTEVSRRPFTPGSSSDVSTEALAIVDADYTTGRRVAELTGVRPGVTFVRVSLIARNGEPIVERVTSVQVSGRVSMIVVVSRACRDVVCPAPGGDPESTSCLAGRCVPPECSPQRPDLCGEPECTSAADCAGGEAACALGLCVEGECFELGDHSQCASDEWCNPEVGCVLRGTPTGDAGPGCPAVETNCADAFDDDCDGLVDCADPDCGGRSCDDGNACTEDDVCGGDGGACAGTPIECDDDNVCTDDACDPASGACVFEPNTASCDDGLFCNGADTCAGGACAVHAGPPCDQFCSESARACTECESDSDCGTPPPITWGACDWADGCDESAQQTGTQTTLQCVSGMCTTTVTHPTRDCTRETDGMRPAGCNSTTYGSYGACGGYAGACDTTGTQSRSVDTQACSGGTCRTTRTSESRGCSRASRDGVQCGGSTRNRCCGGSCRDIWSDEAHCGGCGLACAGGLSCTIVRQGGGAACYECIYNAQCSGGNTSLATCWARSVGGPGYCRCQSDAGCAPGQRCHRPMDYTDNYCYYP